MELLIPPAPLMYEWHKIYRQAWAEGDNKCLWLHRWQWMGNQGRIKAMPHDGGVYLTLSLALRARLTSNFTHQPELWSKPSSLAVAALALHTSGHNAGRKQKRLRILRPSLRRYAQRPENAKLHDTHAPSNRMHGWPFWGRQ